MADEPELVRTQELAEMLGVTRGTVWEWSRHPNFPPPVDLGLGRCNRVWRRADITKWLQSRPPIPASGLATQPEGDDATDDTAKKEWK